MKIYTRPYGSEAHLTPGVRIITLPAGGPPLCSTRARVVIVLRGKLAVLRGELAVWGELFGPGEHFVTNPNTGHMMQACGVRECEIVVIDRSEV